MMRLFRIFQNPFILESVSFDELVAGTTDTLQRLIANNPGAVFNSLITSLTTALSQVALCATDDIVKLGLRKAAKQAKDTFRTVLPEQLGKIYSKVAGFYGIKAPQLNMVFPSGREIFHDCTDDALDEHLQAVINGLTPLAAEMGAVGAAALGDAGGLYSTWIGLYSASELSTGSKTATESEKRAARENLAAKLHVALLTLALHRATESSTANKAVTDAEAVDMAALYFRQDLFEDPDSPEEPEEPPPPSP